MGGSTLPTASTPGYGWFRGRVACDCLAAWLTAAERLGLARGLIKYELDIVQLTGTASASAGTHSAGGVFDVRQCTTAWVRLFREMGAAAWPRVDVDDKIDGDPWENNEHTHGVIDCPHNGPAAYQIPAYWRGYSGLGQATSGTYAGMWGYGSKDPDPWRPAVRRTWREGIAWADAQTAALTAQQEDIVATLDELEALLRKIVREEVGKAVWGYKLVNRYTKDAWSAGSYVEGGSTWANQAQARTTAILSSVGGLNAALKALTANPALTPDQVVAAVNAALDDRITGAEVHLDVTPPTTP